MYIVKKKFILVVFILFGIKSFYAMDTPTAGCPENRNNILKRAMQKYLSEKGGYDNQGQFIQGELWWKYGLKVTTSSLEENKKKEVGGGMINSQESNQLSGNMNEFYDKPKLLQQQNPLTISTVFGNALNLPDLNNFNDLKGLLKKLTEDSPMIDFSYINKNENVVQCLNELKHNICNEAFFKKLEKQFHAKYSLDKKIIYVPLEEEKSVLKIGLESKKLKIVDYVPYKKLLSGAFTFKVMRKEEEIYYKLKNMYFTNAEGYEVIYGEINPNKIQNPQITTPAYYNQLNQIQQTEVKKNIEGYIIYDSDEEGKKNNKKRTEQSK